MMVSGSGNGIRPKADTLVEVDGVSQMLLATDSPVSDAIRAVQSGDVEALSRLLSDHPELASARIDRGKADGLTLLHFATDWPGHFPNVHESVERLVAAGADPSAHPPGKHPETPLHWAASSNDVSALDALLDAGAEIEATGAVIGNGTALDDAVAFGQWHTANRLVERGAQMKLWHGAALGLLDRVEEWFDPGKSPSAGEVTEAFWQACHGGQLDVAKYLLGQGADVNWIGFSDSTPLDMATSSNENPGAPTCDDDDAEAALVSWLEEQGAKRRYQLAG